MKRLVRILATALGLAMATPAAAQTAVAGNWQATVTFGQMSQRVGLVLTQSGNGYSAMLFLIDQNGATVPVQQTTLTANALHLDIPTIRGAFDGTVNAAATEITGAISQQDMKTALTFRRVDKLDPPPTFADKEKEDVVAAINAYFHAFTIKDWDGFKATLRAPFTRWPAGGTPNVIASLDEVVAGYKTARDGLDGTAYALSRAAEMAITPLSPTAAMVDVHWRRDKQDGSLFQEGAEILTVVKTPTGWKINGNLQRALNLYGKKF